ncbi:MFS transporter [Streptomyces buecherae]|uniref:MFS transporter n=1 Tax=Streptomyces buecherae TaxID=2763006 RepID=UPI0027E26A2A|nr:MFS transporter [Streptomyces buecherae]
MTTSPVDPTGSQSAPVRMPLRGTRNFRNLWLSRVLSVWGSSVTLVAMPVLVYQETKSPFLVSLVAASEALPYVLFGLLAGAVADRAHRRRLMVGADLLNCACVGSVPLAAALGALTPAHVLTAAFLSSTLYVFFDAASYGLVPAAVGRDRLAEANSALWGGETAVRIAGTAMAGTLIAVTSASGALALDALSFLASALLLRGIGYAPTHRGGGATDRPGLLASIREGVRFLWGHPVLRTMTVAGGLQSFAGGAFIGQLVIFADRELDIGASDARIGLLFTSWSAGGILGSLLLPRLRRRVSALRIMLFALPASAVLGLAAVLATDWRVALVAIAAWGSTYLLVIVNTMTYAQEVTPEELQGRVNTTRRMLSSGLGVPLGALVASAVTVAVHVRAGLLLAVAAIALASVIVWATYPRARAEAEEAVT